LAVDLWEMAYIKCAYCGGYVVFTEHNPYLPWTVDQELLRCFHFHCLEEGHLLPDGDVGGWIEYADWRPSAVPPLPDGGKEKAGDGTTDRTRP
jgi:hypothetical protein